MTLSIQIDTKAYPRAADKPILEGINFEISPAEFVAVIGPSGCGKTTLMNIVAGLDTAFSGRVDWPEDATQRRLGYVFQNPRLLPWLSVRENVRLVLDDPDSATERIDGLLDAMELTAFADYYPNRISLGMQRRAALARAFAVEPQLLLMDEPFVSLDLPTASLLRSLLLRVWDTHRSRVLFVTHDLREATQLADRILFLSRSPARVIGQAEVDIPRAQRAAPELIAVRFRQLRSQFAALYERFDVPGSLAH